jgi:hypothetical protein
MSFERVPPYGTVDKARPLSASYSRKGSGEGSLMSDCFPDNPSKQVFDYVAEPINVTDNSGGGGMGAKTGLYAIPVDAETVTKAIPEIVKKCGYVPEMFNAYNKAEIINKSPTLSTGSMVTSSCAVNRLENICCYAQPCEWNEDGKPTKAISQADGKTYRVHKVENGIINIKGKDYPIKLADGYYIIRKLTVRECMRLQTIPEWYEFPVSDAQAYKQIGNGWTCEVITHLIKSCLAGKVDDFAEQIKFF